MKKLILISAMILCGASYAQESFTIDDALRMDNVGDVKILPDGSSVFYSISSLDWSKNERTKRYFLASADGSSVREYIGRAGGESFSFSPDGKSLAFLREVESDGDSDESEMQLIGIENRYPFNHFL